MIMKKVVSLLALILFVSSSFGQESIRLKNEGVKAYKKRDFVSAINFFEQSIAQTQAELAEEGANTKKLTKQKYDLFYKIGVCAYYQGKNDKNYNDTAIVYFNKAKEVEYGKYKTYMYLANCYKALDKGVEMEALLREGIQKYPGREDKMKRFLYPYYFKQGNKHYIKAVDFQKEANAASQANNKEKYDKALENSKKSFEKALPYMETAYKVTCPSEADDDSKEILQKALDASKKALSAIYQELGKNADARFETLDKEKQEGKYFNRLEEAGAE